MDHDARVSFAAEGDALRVRDRLDGGAVVLHLDREPALQPALTDLFPYPVDRAVSVTAASVTVEPAAMAILRDAGGDLLEYFVEPTSRPAADYLIELEGALKTYLRVSDAGLSTTGVESDGPLTLEFDAPTTVTVGARSRHTRPEATITVPDDPEALMAAVSRFGSAIKEHSAERSWPTLRGHPPRIRRGDALDVPDALERPDTGVTITVPPTRADVQRVAPLAYYLGADVEPGDEAALHLENGYAEPLRTDDDRLADRVTSLLERCLLLDSLVRTAGYTPSKRWEYDRIGGRLPFYPPSLYGEPLSAQLMEYLEVDAATVAPYVPALPRTALLRPTPADAELLPYLAYALAPVAVADGVDAPRLVPDAAPGRLEESAGGRRAAGAARSGTARITPASYENGFDRVRPEPGEATALFVTADAERGARLRESVVPRLEAAAFARASVLVDPAADRLRERLTGDVDLAVCDLPTTAAGVRCADGFLPTDELEPFGPGLVVLEDAPTPAAAEGLVRNGAVVAGYVGGRLSLDRVATFARLLGRGLPASQCASLAGVEAAGLRYVGDPAHEIVCDSLGSPPIVLDATATSPTEHAIGVRNVTSRRAGVGMERSLFVDWADDANFLLGAERDDFSTVPTAELRRLAAAEDTIVRINGEVVFADDDVSESDIRACAERALARASDG